MLASQLYAEVMFSFKPQEVDIIGILILVKFDNKLQKVISHFQFIKMLTTSICIKISNC